MSWIQPGHPRAESLRIRERLVNGFKAGLVVSEGLAAHGRGEAFDYILGEQTTQQARRAIDAAVVSLLVAKRPVISVNGNVAALVPSEVVELAKVTKAAIEVNLFHGSAEREQIIARYLRKHGAGEILGVDEEHTVRIPEVYSNRRKVDKRGIAAADVVLVSLEDGDRTEALKKLGKKVIAVDLNPMSRTARAADITIVDNIVRAFPAMVRRGRYLLHASLGELQEIIESFNNTSNLKEMLKLMLERLEKLSRA